MEKIAHPIPFFLFLGLFVLISMVHLIFGYQEKKIPRQITKPFCGIFLSLAILFVSLDLGFLCLALALATLGDFLLIFKKNNVAMLSGCLSFFLAHLTFIGLYLHFANVFVWQAILISLGALAVFGLLIFFVAKRFVKSLGMKVGVPLYFGNLVLHFAVATYASIALSPWFVFSIVGAIVFFYSDLLIVINAGVKKIAHRDFRVMATYLTALALICSGYLLFFLI